MTFDIFPGSVEPTAERDTELPPPTRTDAAPRRARVFDRALLVSVARSFAPAFPLRDSVAIHPLVGLFDRPYAEAAATTRRTFGADVLPSPERLVTMLDEGEFGLDDVRAALRAAGRAAGEAEALLGRMRALAAQPRPGVATPEVTTLAGDRSKVLGVDLDAKADAVLVAWLSTRHDLGVSAFASRHDADDAFADFLRWAEVDRTLALAGVRGTARFFARVPRSLERALTVLSSSVRLRDVDEASYLRRLGANLYGYLGMLRGPHFAERPDDVDALVPVLAARLALDVAIATSSSFGDLDEASVERIGSPDLAPPSDRLVVLHAAELAVQRRFEEAVRPPSPTHPAHAVHAVFCIDVRSEPARRALEAALHGATTAGFAGFFGVSVSVDGGGPVPGGARCPALLTAKHEVPVARAHSDLTERVRDALLRMRRSLLGGLGHAELGLPLSLGPLLAGHAGDLRPDHEHHAVFDATGIPLDERVAMAAAALRAAVPSDELPRLLVLVGHDATSHNNPQHAGLTCGACGGHGGALNARLLAAFLRDEAVRERLARLGFAIHDGTTAVAAVHDTTTDTLRLLDVHAVPHGHAADIARLARAFERASAALRRGRVPASVCPADEPEDDRVRATFLGRRARDWAEPRPEWALANNALFVAARRCRTAELDLGSRAFLHDYDARRDPDGALLRLILSAPMVVAAHINGAYGLSVTAPDHFGAGPKNVHTISGGLGVVRGNGGDLRVGLARESVFDGDRPAHQPLRLSVYVEASPERLTAALEALPAVRALLDHEYVHLLALGETRGAVVRYRPHVGF